jgi:hypothetical protein
MSFSWRIPEFKKLTDEQIAQMDKNELAESRSAAKSNIAAYKGKVFTHAMLIALLVGEAFVFTLVSDLISVILLCLVPIPLLFARRAYRRLVREIKPQFLRLGQRISELENLEI